MVRISDYSFTGKKQDFTAEIEGDVRAYTYGDGSKCYESEITETRIFADWSGKELTGWRSKVVDKFLTEGSYESIADLLIENYEG